MRLDASLYERRDIRNSTRLDDNRSTAGQADHISHVIRRVAGDEADRSLGIHGVKVAEQLKRVLIIETEAEQQELRPLLLGRE